VSYIQQQIHDYFYGITRADFDQFGDRNLRSRALNFLLRKDASPLDSQAQELSEMAGVEITPQDFIDYILDRVGNPGKYRKMRQQKDTAPQKLAQDFGMNNRGFFSPQIEKYFLKVAARKLGLGVREAFDREGTGRLVGYYLTKNGRFYNPLKGMRQQKEEKQEWRGYEYDVPSKGELVNIKWKKVPNTEGDVYTTHPDGDIEVIVRTPIYPGVRWNMYKGKLKEVSQIIGLKETKRMMDINDLKTEEYYGDTYSTTPTPPRPMRQQKDITIEQQKEYDTIQEVADIIVAARQNNFTDAAIKDYLVRRRKFSARMTNDLLSLPVDEFNMMPPSFGDIKGGMQQGVKLFKRVNNFMKKLSKKFPKMSRDEVMDKTIAFLHKQPEYKKEADTYKVKGETRSRKGLSTLQAIMESELTKTLAGRPTENMAQKIRMANMLVNQRKKGKRDLQAIQRELRNFIRKSLPAALYSKPEVLRLYNKIAIADQGNIDNIIEEVTEFVTEKNAKGLESRIDNLLNGKYEVIQSGRKKGVKIDLKTRERINRIKKYIAKKKATAEEIIEQNLKLNKKFNELNAKPEQTEAEKEAIVDLQIAMELNNARLMENKDINKVASLDRVDAFLSQIVEEGKTTLREELDEAHKTYLEEFAYIYEDITGTQIDLSDPNWKAALEAGQRGRDLTAARKKHVGQRLIKLMKGIGRGLKTVFTTAEGLDGLMDQISTLPGKMFEGRTQELVTERVDAASREFKRRQLLNQTVVVSKMQELFGKRWRKVAQENTKIKPTGIFINPEEVSKTHEEYKANPNAKTKKAYYNALAKNELVYSQNKMYYLYNQFKDPANHPAFESAFGPDYQRIMQEIDAKLTPEAKAFADWQVDELFPSLYRHYNEAYRKIYRTNMPWNRFYAGMLYRDGIEAEPLDLLANNTIYNTAVGAGSTILRQQSKKAIVATDGTDALFTYLRDMEYFAAYGETIRNIDKLFTNPLTKKAIIDNYGQTTMNMITDAIQKLANKGARSYIQSAWINSMNNIFILSRLGVNPVVMLKQLTSFVTYANDIGVVNWMRYGSKYLTSPKQIGRAWKEIRENSVYMQDRRNTPITQIIETYTESGMESFVPNPVKNNFVDFLMWTTKFGDRTAIMVGGLPNYLYYKNEYKKKNPKATEQEVIDYAIIKFERDTKRTQQSQDLQDKDYFQTGNPIVRGFNMFLTTPKQYLRKEIMGVRNLWRKLAAWDKKAGKGTWVQNLRTFVIYHGVMPVFFQWVANGLPGALADWEDEDNDDLLRALIIGNFNALFIIGQMVASTGDFFTGKPWAEQPSSLPPLEVLSNLFRQLKRSQTLKDPEKRAAAQQKLILEIIQLTGLPASNLKRIQENMQKLIEGGEDPEKVIMRLMNYSEYQITTKEQRQPKKKKGLKLRKKEMEKYFPDLFYEQEEMKREMFDEDIEQQKKEMKEEKERQRQEMLEEMYY